MIRDLKSKWKTKRKRYVYHYNLTRHQTKIKWFEQIYKFINFTSLHEQDSQKCLIKREILLQSKILKFGLFNDGCMDEQ